MKTYTEYTRKINIHAGLEVMLLDGEEEDEYHNEYAVTLADKVVSGGMPSSIADVVIDCTW